jgi:hypothetical protein
MVASKPLPVSVHVRLPDRGSELAASWLDVDVQTLRTAAPWRTFRSYKGQRHYSGSFWSGASSGNSASSSCTAPPRQPRSLRSPSKVRY